MQSLRTTQVENLVKSIRQIADTNTIFIEAGICSTTDFYAVTNWDTVYHHGTQLQYYHLRQYCKNGVK